MTSYHLWTVGCQMNVADSERLGLSLDQLGYESVARAEDADIVVLNSCVVRQGAEDKVVGRLDSLKSYKKEQSGRDDCPHGLHGRPADGRSTETIPAR